MQRHTRTPRSLSIVRWRFTVPHHPQREHSSRTRTIGVLRICINTSEDVLQHLMRNGERSRPRGSAAWQHCAGGRRRVRGGISRDQTVASLVPPERRAESVDLMQEVAGRVPFSHGSARIRNADRRFRYACRVHSSAFAAHLVADKNVMKRDREPAVLLVTASKEAGRD
jgi:hypothetical protein